MTDRVELAERVFAPGNLVHGSEIENFRSCVELGVKPAKALNKPFLYGAREFICFGMLGKTNLPRRYIHSMHYGPKQEKVLGRVAVIVSGELLLSSLPGQVYAVGDFFWNSAYESKATQYDFDEPRKNVFGIPIQAERYLRHPDEVRVKPEYVGNAVVGSNLWVGIVVSQIDLQETAKRLIGLKEVPSLPVFSTHCELIAENLAELVK